MHGTDEDCIQRFVGSLVRKNSLEIPRRRWWNNIKMDLILILRIWTEFFWLRKGSIGGFL
jgi:hypothetical protein